MSKEVKLTINQKSHKGNFVSASFASQRNKISKRIDKNPLLITELEILVGVRMLRKDAKHFCDLIEHNRAQKATVTIKFD